MPLVSEIRKVYDRLPASERALADLLLEFPGDIAVYSASELARRANVSNAAVSRLIKRLRFRDYRHARQSVREAQASGQPIYLNNSLVRSPTQAGSLEWQLENDVRGLRATYEALDAKALAAAIRAVRGARSVWIVGYRNSYFFAAYLRRQLHHARTGVHLLPHPGQTLMEDLSAARPRDVAIVVGVRRRSVLTERALVYLGERGVPVLYLTDHRAVRTARYAKWCFRCHARGVSLFDSYVSLMSLCNYIGTEVVAESGEAGRQRLNEIEAGMDASEEIDPRN